ncbi:hypothetical protein LA080_005491 [Diaporthe eres]|nr:hypothetical protein LA080_005491 [Diaporthe eres]
MPTLSAIQLQLKRHEQWLIDLRQDSCMTLAKVQTELESQKRVGSRVFRALDSQKAFGRIHDLYISEKLITEQSLQKKRKNAKPAQPLASCLADADQLLTQLPHRVTVALRASPQSSGSRIEPGLSPQPVLHGGSGTNLDGDASMLLDNTSANNDAGPESNAIMGNTDTSSSLFGSQFSGASTVNQSQLALPLANMATYSAGIPGVHHGLHLLLAAPSFQSNIALADLEMDFEASYFIPSPIEDLSSSLQCEAEELLSNLQSMMCIETAEGDCCGPLNVIGGPGSFTDGFFQLLLFSTVNNFAGIEAIIPMELAIKFIDQHEPTRSTILNQFRSGALTIFSRALAEKLLGAAIEACDAKAVHDLLALEIVKPDDIVCTESLPGNNHVDDKSHRLRTAIEKASILRHSDTIDLLLRFGADVNKTYENTGSQSERGALECAISLWGQYRPIDFKLVDLLLNNGATVSSRLVEAAVRWEDTGLIEKLMSRHSPSQHRDCFFQVLIDAAEYLKNDAGYKVIRQIMRHEEVALKLLEAGADMNWLGAKSPLLEALRSRSRSITWAILEHEVSVKTDDSRYLLDETPLEAATAWGDPGIIKGLFVMGANINTCRHEPPLSIAIRAGERILNLILQNFRKKHPKGRSGFGGKVLHHGLQTHDEALLDLCLNAGFDVNSLTSHKEHGTVTALGLAIQIHHGRCLGLTSKLLNAGGDANAPTSEGRERLSSAGPNRVIKRVIIRQTAFLDAIETKSLPLVELLISNGADVRKEAKLGLKHTPLQKACEAASHTIVDLLAHNADVSADPAAHGGATALQLASKAGSTRIAKSLLAMGANVNAPGVRIGGRSAIEYASEYGRLNMIPVLFHAAGGRFAGGQCDNAIVLAQENGHSACAVLLRSVASGNQGLMEDSILAEDGGNAGVVC